MPSLPGSLIRHQPPKGPPRSFGNHFRRLHGLVREIEHAENDRLARQLRKYRGVKIRLRGLDRDLVAAAGGELGKKGVTRRPVVDDRGVAEADVDRGRALDAL